MKKNILLLALMALVANASAEDYLHIQPAAIQRSSNANLTLKLAIEAARSAWQMDIDVPTGIDITIGNISKVDGKNSSHHFDCHKLPTSARIGYDTYRIILFSTNKSNLTTGDILQLPITSSGSIADGVYPVYVHNVVIDDASEGHSTTNIPMATSFIKVGSPRTQALVVEGNMPSFVTTEVNTNADITSIDIKDGGSVSGILNPANQNTLIYTTTAKGYRNEVVNGVCDNLEVINGYDFCAMRDFTATEATYDRSMGNQWGTICLPYDVDIDNAADPYDFYVLRGLEDDEMLIQKMTGTLPAGTPAIIRRNSDYNNVNIVRHSTNVKAGNGLALAAVGTLIPKGTLAQTNITRGYYISNNLFWDAATYQVNGTPTPVSVTPFRAYFDYESVSPAPKLRVRMWQEEETGIDILNALVNGEAEYFDLEGRPIEQMQTGVNLVKMPNGTMKKVRILNAK